MADYNKFLEALGQRESSGRYDNDKNPYGYLGKYQMGEAPLIDTKYYKPDGTKKNDWIGGWTGKNNIKSKGDFLNSQDTQEKAIREYMDVQWKYIKNNGLDKYIGQTFDGIEITASGLLAAVHLKGAHGVKNILERKTTKTTDGFNTDVREYLSKFSGYEVPFYNSNNIASSFLSNIANKLNAFLNGINSFFQGKDDANFYTVQKGDSLAFKKIISFVAFTVLMIYNISSSYALEIIKTPLTINYIDLNNDGAKDMVVVGVYATEIGGYSNYVYSFYLKQDKSNYFIVPIIDNGYEYTAIAASKAVNCSESGNDITYISAVKIIKNRGKVFLLIAEKKKTEGDESIYLTKEKFQFKVYVLEKGDVVWTFKKYKMQESRSKYCDANDAFSKELKFIDLGGQPK